MIVIHDEGAFELRASLQSNSHGCGTTLSIESRYPTARQPEWHLALQLTLPPESLLRLADAIRNNVGVSLEGRAE